MIPTFPAEKGYKQRGPLLLELPESLLALRFHLDQRVLPETPKPSEWVIAQRTHRLGKVLIVLDLRVKRTQSPRLTTTQVPTLRVMVGAARLLGVTADTNTIWPASENWEGGATTTLGKPLSAQTAHSCHFPCVY
jgi:hypothetical protein